MDNSSLRARFSLSSTNMSTPIAESTCLNGANRQTKFNWGEGTISPRSRNNSLTTKNASISKNLNGTPPKVSMAPISRIDPRTYVDIHSNGLASRIVKYHDNSARCNRSLSMGNLYNKPGQFPVVHLKKNELQYKAKKCRNLSMTRIAAPEKSIFHGNTLSSILRSGSIVGLQKSDEEISRENRPILHPPPTENEMAPTRSVLDVLKEISRKRINSDELDGTELVKKHCKEPELDTIAYNGQKTQSKRQRETSTSVATNLQISPEQQAVKKRMCNYNNDILSSLSSSNLSMNKKKNLEMQSQKRTTELSSTITSTEVEFASSRSEKQNRVGGNLDLEHIPQSIKPYTPITLLPRTPPLTTASGDELDKNRIGKATRSASEPVVPTKPKLTLFNKDYDEEPTNVHSDSDECREDGDLRGIQFVKPKKSSSLSLDGTLLLEKTKKSKLALMLKGLKGELDEEDEVDALPTQKQVGAKAIVSATTIPSDTTAPAAMQFGTVAAVTTAVTPTPDTIIKSVVVAPTTTASVVKRAIQFNPPASTASVNSSASNGFQSMSTTVVTSTLSAPAVVSTTSTPIPSVVTSVATSIPALGGFSFGLNKPLSPPSAATATTAATPLLPMPQTRAVTSSSAATLPAAGSGKVVGIKQLGFGTTTTNASSTTPSLIFGALSVPAAQAPSVSTTNSNAAPPVFGQSAAAAQPPFSFGSLAALNSTSTTTATPAVMTTSAPTFNFGGSNSSFGKAVSQPPANAILSMGTFASAANPISQPETKTVTEKTSSSAAGGFSFPGPSSQTEAPKTGFGSIIPNQTAPVNANATFSFSANKPALATQPNPQSAFAFGSPGAPITTTPQASMFGSTTPIKPANSFPFAASAPAAPTKSSFSFSSTSDKPVAPNQPLPSIGGFSFSASAASNVLSTAEPNKNIFAAPAPGDAPAKSLFSFGSASSNSIQPANKPTMFGASTDNSTNLFGAPAPTSAQSSPFAFGSSSSALANQEAAKSAPTTNLFGGATATNNLGGSVFGAPSATVAPQQQSSTFKFGASSSSTPAESSKPTGGFVFGSSSSIGSNASKPATDMNKTFVFGDGNTTITPAPARKTSMFGGSNATSSSNSGTTENKMFSFGAVAAPSAGNNNTFGGSRQAVNQSPVFNFGAAAPASTAPAQNGNSFPHQQQPTGVAPPSTMLGTSDRPIRKAMRRLHKT